MRKLPLELSSSGATARTTCSEPRRQGLPGAPRGRLRLEIAELGAHGTFEAFAEAKRLGYRLGLASWTGAEAASRAGCRRLISAFEELDTADSFVHPAQASAPGAWRPTPRVGQALAEIEAVVAAIWRDGARAGATATCLAQSRRFGDRCPSRRVPGGARPDGDPDGRAVEPVRGAGLDAGGPAPPPGRAGRVRAGDDRLLERSANESIRLAQRSITLRRVLQPIEVEPETGKYRLAPGVFLATMLSVTNASAAPGLAASTRRHYGGAASPTPLPAKELVSTFGHGRHTCPAQRFSISRSASPCARLLERYELTPLPPTARPLGRQLGGVARADLPCPVGTPPPP